MMDLSPGARVGPYEILAPIGAGGMGQVYRASDPRLGRDVAIKVLPSAFAQDADRRARFEREARTVAALSHPNIVGLYDTGVHGGHPFVVMELLEGETLREKLGCKPVPVKRAVEIARAVADGLSAAHDKGVIHRDLKPENLVLTRDGRVKILDFGLAKVQAASGAQEPVSDEQPTGIIDRPTVPTCAGMVLGSIGYMSPEQVRGEPLDARSDLFALGVILWEMLAGTRPFHGRSAVEVMHAIAQDEPPDLDESLKVPPVLERIVRTCLAKDPAGRFRSAHDLAFSLETLSSGSQAALAAKARPRRTSWRWAITAAGTLLVVALGAGAFQWASAASPPLPSFRKLTFGRGAIDAARFVPGSRDVAYSARWQGEPSTVYVLREGSVEPRALEVPGAMLLATSAQGEAAVMTRPMLISGLFAGTVSSVSLAGGEPREIVRTAFSADIAGDGAEICAVTRVRTSLFQLEWPQGEVLVKPSLDLLRSPRVRNGMVAFFEAPPASMSDGQIRVISRGQPPRSIARSNRFTSLAWGPDGREVWFSTFDGSESRIEAVSLQGRARTLARFPGRLELADVDSAGRVLAIVSSETRQAFGRAPGTDHEVELTWLDAQAPQGLRSDGGQVLLARATAWEMSEGASLYLRPFDRAPGTKIGTGSFASALSADGRWVATLARGPGGQPGVRVIPTGAGPSRWYELTGSAASTDGLWFHPGGRSIYMADEVANHLGRLDLDTRAITPNVVSGQVGFTLDLVPIAPDGKRLLLLDLETPGPDDQPFLYKLFESEQAAPTPARGNASTEVAAGWTSDSRELYLYDRNTLPTDVFRWNPTTGERRPFLRIAPPDLSGVWGISWLSITPSGNAYAYSVLRRLSDLYLIEGLK